jgi:transposase, IS30 family
VRVGRPRLRRSLEREFWGRVRWSSSWEEAAAAVGVSVSLARRWVAESGGVKPRLVEPARSLSYRERCRIEGLHAAGLSRAEIARRLGRHRSTIGRELDRNGTRRDRRGGYSAGNAQSKADQRARRPKPAKLATNLPLRRTVQDRLERRDSPEQIAHRLRQDFPDDPEMWVSHETIYQSLYVQARGGLRRELTRHLRTGRTLRTLVERMTRFVMLLHLPGGHTADIVQEAMVTKMATLPDQLRRSLTWDQGIEMANHVQIAEATGLSIYFCDPHAPWQRGTNENTNGLLRQYLPKGEDLAFYGPGLLDQIASELNGRPRKTLHWRTPAEALDALLSGQSDPPVATTG